MFQHPNLLIVITALVLFFIGLFILVNQPHFIKKLIAVELMAGAVNLNILAAGLRSYGGLASLDPFAGVLIILSTTISAAIAAVGFGFAHWSFRHTETLDTDSYDLLKK